MGVTAGGSFVMRLLRLALIGATLLCGGTQAIAAPGDDIGAAVRVVNLVTAEYATDQRRLATGDNVRQDELIEVSADGTGEIKLRDNTQLALGPGSRLLLDQFVYDPHVSGGAIVLQLVKGAFRFMTGIAAKPAYVIRTPTASITVRGTIFDVYVQSSGMSWLLLIEGAIEVCNARDDCRLHDEPGKLIRITPDGNVGSPVRWVGFPKDGELFESAFPFVITPPQFDSDPVFTPDDIVGGTSPDGTDDGSGPKDDGVEEANDDPGTVPPSTSPQLRCWGGWKQVAKGWSATGWRVEKRERGHRVVYCAKRVMSPPADPVVPTKPECAGGTLVMLKTLPPRWNCVCPVGTTRQRTGKHAYACKGSPGEPQSDPEKDCLKKGWKWTRKGCVDPGGSCPKGYVGNPPNCVKPPPSCPKGYVGTPPKCTKLLPPGCPKGYIGEPPNCRKPPRCPKGYIGTPPNCRKLPPKSCPKGYIGQPPNCKKMAFNKPIKGLKDVKKQFKNPKVPKKD
jgi:FecR protein